MKFPTALVLFPLVLGAVEVELDFTITNTPGKRSRADIKYQVGATAATFSTYEDTIPYSGNLVVTANVDPENGEIDEFEFTGGEITTPDLDATLVTYVGTQSYTVIFTTRGIVRTPASYREDTMEGGVPDGRLHYTDFTEDSESLLVTRNFYTNIPSVADGYTLELAEIEGFYLIGPDIIFPLQITTSSEGTSVALGIEYSASLHSLISLPVVLGNSLLPAAGLPGRFFIHEYSETGNIYADGSYIVPNDYGQWALDNDLDLTTGEENNAAGMPYALLYAFDLPPDAASLPLTFSSTPRPTVALDLPDRGLGYTVHVEYSPDLTSEFIPLPDGNFVTGTDSLDAGSTATAVLSYPGGERGFLRFYVDL